MGLPIKYGKVNTCLFVLPSEKILSERKKRREKEGQREGGRQEEGSREKGKEHTHEQRGLEIRQQWPKANQFLKDRKQMKEFKC